MGIIVNAIRKVFINEEAQELTRTATKTMEEIGDVARAVKETVVGNMELDMKVAEWRAHTRIAQAKADKARAEQAENEARAAIELAQAELRVKLAKAAWEEETFKAKAEQCKTK